MTKNPIIEIRNLGKEYDIEHSRSGYITMRDILTTTLKNPFSIAAHKLKRVVGLTKKEEFWALKNINLKINKGEVVGIIGPNGAGKSTLLKILTGITPPTEGEVTMRGKVASLLEVGTGFHPELTGRENIFLNGAILGMKKKEIEAKFDEIVTFAGVERFLDTPVKRYSSGMYVRLAFSVAAHMEPDILIIDEVLAVGDAEFQKKCLGKMEEVTRKQGRTILFVSHNLVAIESLCHKTVLLENGQVKLFETTSKVIDHYTSHIAKTNKIKIGDRKDRSGDGRLKINDFKLQNQTGQTVRSWVSGENVELWLEYNLTDNITKEIDLAIGIDSLPNQNRITLISSKIINQKIKVKAGNHWIKIKLTKLPLNVGHYQFTVFAEEAGKILDWVKGAGEFTVDPGHFYESGKLPEQGNLLLDYELTNE